MEGIKEKVELTEQKLDHEKQDLLASEYEHLSREAALGECRDMAEYYAQKRQALLEERQEFYQQKKQQVQAEMDAHQDSMNRWRVENTTTYGLPKYASQWETEASFELKNNGATDWYRYAIRQADLLREEELKEQSK